MHTMSEENGNLLDLGSIDFTPDWAKKGAGVSVGKFRPQADERRGERKSFGGSKPFGDRAPSGDRKPFGERKPFAKRPFDGRMRAEARPRPLDVDVKILPDPRALGTIIRKLQNDIHAYKLKDLANFLLDNPSSVLLKITPRPSDDPAARQPHFHQCKACGFASTNGADVVEHVVNAHLGDYYDAKEVPCEPPKGNFSCVAKCGLSGVLLGPPNIHEFNAVVREMIRTKYPAMSEADYRARIEMVRDADAIEEWRKGATKKTLFFPKGTADQEGAQGLAREAAEGEFKRTILPSLLTEPKHLMITADVAMASPVKPLQWAVRDALEAERRSPYNMCFALRGALHHRKLKFFRANEPRGPEFVTNVEYRAFDAAHAVPELAAAARFVEENPCCDKSEFPAEPDFEKHMAWLVTTGHVVAFTNGVYSAVEKFPKYGPQWKKRKAKADAPAPAPEAEQPPAADAPVPAPEPAPEAPAPESAAEAPDAVPAPEPAAEAETVEEKKVEEKKDETAAVVAE